MEVSMPKFAKNMSIREINRLKQPGIYAIGHVRGLSVRVNDSGGIAYVYRYRIANHGRSVTIGDKKAITLKDAIAKAHEYSIMRINNKDPFLEKKRLREELLKTIEENKHREIKSDCPTFAIVSSQYIDYKKNSGSFKNNAKGEKTLVSMLINHVSDEVNNKPISEITAEDIRDVLAKIWRTKPSLSRKLVNLLKQIFDWALAMKIYSGSNPASMDGPLKTLMEPFKNDRIEESHFASLDYHELPLFMSLLWEIKTIGALGLMFSILTATRSKAVRYLTWDQLDIKMRVWTIPLENDKSKKHDRIRTIMLSDQAVMVLNTVPKRCKYVFYSSKLTPLSDAVFGKVIKDLNASRKRHGQSMFTDPNIPDENGQPSYVTQHGTARATFKTWAKSDELGNNRRFFDEAVELCLLHIRKDPLKGAYDRSKLEKERQKIMNAWGIFCCSKIPELLNKEK